MRREGRKGKYGGDGVCGVMVLLLCQGMPLMEINGYCFFVCFLPMNSFGLGDFLGEGPLKKDEHLSIFLRNICLFHLSDDTQVLKGSLLEFMCATQVQHLTECIKFSYLFGGSEIQSNTRRAKLIPGRD